MNKIGDSYSDEGIAFPVSCEGIDIFQDVNKICVMVHENDNEETVVLFKHGDYKSILNDIVHLLWIENEDKSHYLRYQESGFFFEIFCHQFVDSDHMHGPICNNQI